MNTFCLTFKAFGWFFKINRFSFHFLSPYRCFYFYKVFDWSQGCQSGIYITSKYIPDFLNVFGQRCPFSMRPKDAFLIFCVTIIFLVTPFVGRDFSRTLFLFSQGGANSYAPELEGSETSYPNSLRVSSNGGVILTALSRRFCLNASIMLAFWVFF